MKIKRQKNTKKARIEIIPMIDVMFFLLATFMLASLSMQSVNSLPVNLAEGKSENSAIEKEITLSVSGDGKIFLNKEPIAMEFLIEKLKPLLSEKNDKLIIAADKKALHGVVAEAMLKARQAGAKHFSIITKSS